MGLIHPGLHPQGAYPQAQRAHNGPADVAQVQPEQPALVAHHHPLTFGDALAVGIFRMIALDVIAHGIGVRLHNAGHHEQQRPQKGLQGNHQADEQIAGEILSKAHKQIAQIHLTLAPGQPQPHRGQTHAHRAHENQNAHHHIRSCAEHGRSDNRGQHGQKPQTAENIHAQRRPGPSAQFKGRNHQSTLSHFFCS